MSKCEPVRTVRGLSPSRRPNRLPTASSRTARPASRIQSASCCARGDPGRVVDVADDAAARLLADRARASRPGAASRPASTVKRAVSHQSPLLVWFGLSSGSELSPASEVAGGVTAERADLRQPLRRCRRAFEALRAGLVEAAVLQILGQVALRSSARDRLRRSRGCSDSPCRSPCPRIRPGRPRCADAAAPDRCASRAPPRSPRRRRA